MSNKTNLPTLSVVIPVYNERKTIESIFNKVYENKLVTEIIIIDDCSTDGSRELLQGKLKGNLSHLILNEKNFLFLAFFYKHQSTILSL